MTIRVKQQFPVIDALQASNWNRQLFEDLAHSGLDAVHVTLVYWENCRQTLPIIGKWNRWFREHDDLILPVRKAGDIRTAHEAGKTGIILGFQNSSPIDDDLSLIQILHDLGIRIMQMTYNNQTLIGAGCYEQNDGGITKFGKNVIREMNRAGMVIDLSHTSEKTSFDAIEISECPVAITHANPLFFHKAVRNKSDALLKELARKGGILGFSIYPFHLLKGTECTLESFCEMISRTADMIGVKHIGIGSDLCQGWGSEQLEYMRSGTWTFEADPGESAGNPDWPEYPAWYREPADFQNIAQGLSDAGFSDEEAGLILGGNWFRFFENEIDA